MACAYVPHHHRACTANIAIPVFLTSSYDDFLQVNGHLERNGQPVDGITVSGAWDKQLWAGYPDGTRKLLWKASPPYQPDAL